MLFFYLFPYLVWIYNRIIPVNDSPIARRQSLQRFLDKRRDRLI